MSYLTDDSVILKKSSLDNTGQQIYHKNANVPDNYVVALQADLITLGFFPGSKDGAFGNKTAMALKNFQEVAINNQRLQHGTIITVQRTYTGEVSGKCDLPSRLELKLWLDSGYQAPISNQPPKAMSGHGTFLYEPGETIQQYGSVQQVADAIRELDMQHAWIRIHDRSQIYSLEPTRSLIRALQAGGIHVAGWGWCHGANVSSEAQLAIDAMNRFELEHYIADIEEGVSGSHWNEAGHEQEIDIFFTKLRNGLSSKSKIAVSSHGFIIWHKPSLMTAAEVYVDYFAPQVYWFSYPNQSLLDAARVSSQDYPLKNPASYMRLCLKVWRDTVQKPLIAAGQAYWGEGTTQSKAEQRLSIFLNEFNNWDKLQGLNWWHLGGSGQSAMSPTMYTALKEAKLSSKFPNFG